MELPIQVAVRIYPYARLHACKTDDGVENNANNNGAAPNITPAQQPSAPPPPQSTQVAAAAAAAAASTPEDANGNNDNKMDFSPAPEASNACSPVNAPVSIPESYVQAIPIAGTALGLPSALPGATGVESIAAGLIQVGAHTMPVTHALAVDTTQSQVFHQTVFPLVNLFLEGFDASVVTYGQRGMGKTYTMYGYGFDGIYNEADQGVVQRCVREIFTHMAVNSERTYAVNIGFVEICGGEIRDLLGMGNVLCAKMDEVFQWLRVGLKNKRTSSVAVVHTLFTFVLEQHWVSKEGLIQHRLSTASFSDLGSSERYGEALPGIPRDVGLQMLEQVVHTLIDPNIMYGINGNIPYNQTTLTTLLKDSFGGRAQTLLMLCVSPLEEDLKETLGNLHFAFKVQCVRNYVIMNTFSDDNTPIAPETGTGAPLPRPLMPAASPPSNMDTFGLQFAASQWFKLVSNAEGLFAKLMSSSAITELEKEQIEEWLFLKQECEECLSSSEALRTQKQLVPIQEADEEPDEEPEDCASEHEEMCQQNSDNDTDTESQRPDLADRLESLMIEFRAKTDALVQTKHSEFFDKQPKAVMESEESFTIRPSKSEIPADAAEKLDERKASVGGRRRSIQPGASLSSAELAMLNRVASREHQQQQQQQQQQQEEQSLDLELEDSCDAGGGGTIAALNEPIEQLQKKLRKLDADIEGRQRQLKEMEETMHLKQNIISELVKNSETRSNAKQRFHKKRAKLEAECEKAKKHMAKALVQGREKAEVERCGAIIAHLEQRLEDLSSMKNIAGESGQKVKKLHQSVAESRKQIEELQKKLKKDRKHRDQLLGELKSLKEARDLGKAVVKVESAPIPMITAEDTHCKQLKAVQARITHLDHILREKSDKMAKCDVIPVEQQEALRHEIRNLRRTRDNQLEQRFTLDRKLKRDKMLTQREERKLLECDEVIEAIDMAIEYKNELICGHKSIDLSTERLQRERGEQMLMARLNKLSEEEMRTLLYKYFNKVIDLRDSSRKLELQLAQLERERDAWEWKERVLSNAVRQARLEGERNAVLLQRQHEMKLTLMLRHLAEETSAGSSTSFSDRGGGSSNMTLTPSTDFDYELDFYKAAQHKATTHKTTALEKFKEANKERSSTGRNIFAKFQVLTRYASAAAAAAAAAGSSSTADESMALIETTTAATATATTATVTTTGARSKDNRSLAHIPPEQLKKLMPPPTATKVTRQKNKIIIQDATRKN